MIARTFSDYKDDNSLEVCNWGDWMMWYNLCCLSPPPIRIRLRMQCECTKMLCTEMPDADAERQWWFDWFNSSSVQNELESILDIRLLKYCQCVICVCMMPAEWTTFNKCVVNRRMANGFVVIASKYRRYELRIVRANTTVMTHIMDDLMWEPFKRLNSRCSIFCHRKWWNTSGRQAERPKRTIKQ